MNVITVKIGTKYKPFYVNNLYQMSKRFVSETSKFFCITDDPTGLVPEITVIPFKNHNLDIIVYNKLYMFSEECSNLFDGECVYFDLDLIIRNDISTLLNRTGDLQVIHAVWRPQHPRGGMDHHHNFNSSCLRWKAGTLTNIWNYFMKDPEAYMSTYYWGMDSFLYYEHKNMNVDVQYFEERVFYSHIYGVDVKLNIEHNPEIKGYRPSKLKHITDKIPVVLFNGPATDDDYLKVLGGLNIINHTLPHSFMGNDVTKR